MKKHKITLENARLLAGLSQEELGEKIGVHRNTIAAYEKDPKSMSIKLGEKVCKVLGYEFDDIFFG